MTKIKSEDRLLESVIAGAQRVINGKDELNKINVFPVADGDTGSNLASLMQTIVDNLSNNKYSTNLLLDEVASAALIGARGNSGIIFAQYLNAVSDYYGVYETNLEILVVAFNKAVRNAYDSLIEPKEGTILSVMRRWADVLLITFKESSSFENALLEAKAEAWKALKETQFQMSILKKNKLVDSGAKGFYYFVSGFTDAYCGESLGGQQEEIIPNKKEEDKPFIKEHFISEAPKNRYCSEFIIKESQKQENDLKELLRKWGDSLVIAGNKKQLKIHIHTNHPESILALLENWGTIIYQKVDDMQLQYEISQNRKSSIAIVTDSVADLSADFILENQIFVLPLNISVGEQNFLDKLTINPQIFEEKYNKNLKMTTSQPSIQSVDSLFSFLEGKYDHIIVISVSSQLSGTYQLIKQRIREKKVTENQVHLIDSKLNSVAQGLLVKQAVKIISEEKPIEAILNEIENIIDRVFIYVAVADLSPMINSGRIPKFLGEVAQKISMHPIISLDKRGNGKLIGGSFSQARSMDKILKKIVLLSKKGQIEELALTHVLSKEAALKLNEIIKEKTTKNSEILDSSAAIGISAGLGSLAVAGLLKEVQ
ncbi:DAK2 domain-containing protein [Lactococcus cremoris]|uniref:DAK2 domain-containing protein n=1 Tax=Lactococcus lactis subsp. cremoris TaxID=1359 RepID=UPI0003ABA387|nr:DegV family protein [Lactococcus cremoris]AGV73123.1 DAK2 domain-containing protein [Lactococcus cremoris subsp. cremoris KW2]